MSPNKNGNASSCPQQGLKTTNSIILRKFLYLALDFLRKTFQSKITRPVTGR